MPKVVFPQSSLGTGRSFAIFTAAGLSALAGATPFTNGVDNAMLLPWQAAEANLLKSPLIMAAVGTIAAVSDGDRRSSVSCIPKKKNIRFFSTGTQTVPPNLFLF